MEPNLLIVVDFWAKVPKTIYRTLSVRPMPNLEKPQTHLIVRWTHARHTTVELLSSEPMPRRYIRDWFQKFRLNSDYEWVE